MRSSVDCVGNLRSDRMLLQSYAASVLCCFSPGVHSANRIKLPDATVDFTHAFMLLFEDAWQHTRRKLRISKQFVLEEVKLKHVLPLSRSVG